MANSPTDKTPRRALIVSLIVIGLILMTFWYMLNIVLLTFLFTFIFYQLLNLIEHNSQKYLHFHLPYKLNIFIVYALFILLLVYSVYRLPYFNQLIKLRSSAPTGSIGWFAAASRCSLRNF